MSTGRGKTVRNPAFRAWLLDRMAAAGMTKRDGSPNAYDLARALGHASNGVAYRWMSGEDQPSFESCGRLAEVFKVPVEVVRHLCGFGEAPDQEADPLTEQVVQRARALRWTPDTAKAAIAMMDVLTDNFAASPPPRRSPARTTPDD